MKRTDFIKEMLTNKPAKIQIEVNENLETSCCIEGRLIDLLPVFSLLTKRFKSLGATDDMMKMAFRMGMIGGDVE